MEKAPFRLLAKVQAFRNETITEEGNTEIPNFWDESRRKGVFDVLRRNTKKRDVYGVCAPISKESTQFDYGIGMEYGGGAVPEGYRVWDVKPTLWAVFSCVGTDGTCVGKTWNRIMQEFLPSSGYNMLDDVDFELYSEGSESFCEIWIPVEKKSK